MQFSSILPFSVGLLRAIALATACFSVAYAQTSLPQHELGSAIDRVPADKLAALIDDELWSAIKESDGASVFEEYIKQYPNGRYVVQAMDRLAGLQKSAKSSVIRNPGTVAGPASSDDSEATLWKVVFQGDNIGSYEVFLKHYPKGRYALLATNRLNIARENAKWKAEEAEQGKRPRVLRPLTATLPISPAIRRVDMPH